MGRYIIRKLVTLPLLLFAVTVIIFTMINSVPGDPVSFLISPELPPKVADARREALGLNDPIPVRYMLWLKEAVTGNLGYSYVSYQPVSERIGERVGPTLLLMSSGLVLALCIGLPLGMYAAVKHYSISDYALTVGAFTAVSVPNFFLGLVLILVFGVHFKILPTGGLYTLGQEKSVGDLLRHLVLPATVIAVQELAIYLRLFRGSLLEVLRADFIRTAQAKGLRRSAVLFGHAFRNSLLPVLTRLGLSLSLLFGGAVVTEQVFQWPGMGMLTIEALKFRDYPVLMGINLIAATLVVFGNLVADILYGLTDPRIRYK